MPMNPTIIDVNTPMMAASMPAFVTTRDCVSFSEPSLLPLVTNADTRPLRACSEVSPERGQKMFRGVPILEAGDDY